MRTEEIGYLQMSIARIFQIIINVQVYIVV